MSNWVQKLKCHWNSLAKFSFVLRALTALNLAWYSTWFLCQIQGGLESLLAPLHSLPGLCRTEDAITQECLYLESFLEMAFTLDIILQTFFFTSWLSNRWSWNLAISCLMCTPLFLSGPWEPHLNKFWCLYFKSILIWASSELSEGIIKLKCFATLYDSNTRKKKGGMKEEK